MPCGVEPHGLGNRTPAQVLWSGTVPDGIAPLRLSHTDIRPDTSEQCSFQRGYGDASEARTRTLQRERLMTLPIRLWHRRKEIWLGKRLLLPCRHGMDTAPVGSHHYILLSLSCSAPGRGRLPASRPALSNDASRQSLSFLRFLARIPGWCYRRDLNPYAVSDSRF